MKLFGKSVSYRIAAKSLKNSNNFIPIAAIALCALLFTTLFSVSSNIYRAVKESDFRQAGTDNQIVSKLMTAAEYSAVSKDPLIAQSGRSIIIGTAADEQLSALPTEVRCADDYFAKHSFAYPSQGRLPEWKDEIAVSTAVLKAYGPNYKIGSKLPVSIQVDGKLVAHTFTVVGTWEADPAQPRQMMFVSKEFASETVPTRTSKYAEGSGMAGYISAMFNIKGKNLEDAYDALTKKYPDVDFSINPVYRASSSNLNMETAAAPIGCILLIFVSAYLIIYNVFYISAANDIREYGLLKAVGCQTRQIRKIMNTKAAIYCFAGIPIGVVLGALFGYFLTPVIEKNMTSVSGSVTPATPFALICAVAFSAATVFLSMRKAAILASKASAVEAMHYIGETKGPGKAAAIRKVTPVSMARGNIRTNKKKLIVIVASIALSLIVMNTTYNIVVSFNLDKLVSHQMITDFRITDTATLSGVGSAEVKTVPETVSEKVKSLKQIKNYGEVYQKYTRQSFSEGQLLGAENWGRRQGDPELSSILNEYNSDNINGKVTTEIYGVSGTLVNKIPVLEGSLDEEKFLSGEGVYITPLQGELSDKYYSVYHPGDEIQVEYGDNKYKSYKVLAVVNIPSAVHVASYERMGFEYVVSDTEFKKNVPDSRPISLLFDADDGAASFVRNLLESYLGSNNYGLGLESKESIKEKYLNLTNMFEIVGYSLCILLGIIGLLNYINTVFSSILARRRELSVLEAVGMTKRQMLKMLSAEGMYYALFSVLAAFAVGIPVEILIIRPLEKIIYFLVWRVTVLPLVICIVPIVLIALIVPIICYKKFLSGNLIDRLGRFE